MLQEYWGWIVEWLNGVERYSTNFNFTLRYVEFVHFIMTVFSKTE